MGDHGARTNAFVDHGNEAEWAAILRARQGVRSVSVGWRLKALSKCSRFTLAARVRAACHEFIFAA